MSQEVRDAACVCGTEWMSELGKDVDLDQIPKEYGGTSPHELEEHPYESRLREYVRAGNEAASTCIAEGECEKNEVDNSKERGGIGVNPQHYMFSPKLKRWIPDDNIIEETAASRWCKWKTED